MENHSPEELDRRVRGQVYRQTTETGKPPLISETAQALGVSHSEVLESFQRLAAGRVLVLQRGSGEILMANPFSAVPTPFVVETNAYITYGNCIWDAMGIPAMLNQDAMLRTSCGDCGEQMVLSFKGGRVQGDDGLLHFAIPALRWWEDIVFN